MFNFLYTIFIYPIYMLVELLFFVANILTQERLGFSIILLSIAVNLMCLPIYNVAEQWQEKERAVQKRMKSKLEKIKSVFKGDERFMMISVYYRQNDYHPLYSLRSVLPLLIQIPFFIAAYNILTNFQKLYGTSFLFIKDLGKPDALLTVGCFSVNILPIVMTLINISASAVYTKGLPVKDKLQLYGTAFIFLILLYTSPSGLVFYWTLNNIFSLCKNVFYKIKLTQKMWYIISLLAAFILTGITVFTASNKRPILFAGAFTFILLLLPLLKKILAYAEIHKHSECIFDNQSKTFYIFLSACIACMLFIGFVIPSTLIASSPQEFSDFENFTSPFGIFYYTFIQVLGCLFWLICIYKLFPYNVQKYFAYLSIIIIPVILINTYIFKGNYGDINNALLFEDSSLLKHSLPYFLLNIFILCITAVLTVVFCYSSAAKFTLSFLRILIFTFITITGISAVSIQKSYNRIKRNADIGIHTDKAYRITKTGQNIILLMLDRSMNFFIDAIFENSEIVKKEYTGFTLYENCIAFGANTSMSTPSLFGGYEYTPEKINERSNELLVDKHNEALSVLPKLFTEHNWNVSFTDPPWLNYSWIPDLSVFKSYNMIAKNIDMSGKYRNRFLVEKGIVQDSNSVKVGIRRNMLYFSFFRILPCEIRRIFYAGGKYGGIGSAIYIPTGLTDSYAALEHITEEVEFVNDKNCFNIIANTLTHEPPTEKDMHILKKDFLIPLAKKYCFNQYTEEHFYANYLAHESCAHFFKFLKDNNCWDNTRIIIAGDHGRYSMRTTTMDFLNTFTDTAVTPESFIPLLMIKDFYSGGALKKNGVFMTLADIPGLVTADLSPEMQKNPFSKLTFKETVHKNPARILQHANWPTEEAVTQFKAVEAHWFYVKENVYDSACWSSGGS